MNIFFGDSTRCENMKCRKLVEKSEFLSASFWSRLAVLTVIFTMSNLSVGQHKQLLTAVLGYLQDLQAHAPAGAVADALELNNAICSLGAASGLTTPAERTSYDIQPHTLISIFNAAGIAAPVRSKQIS